MSSCCRQSIHNGPQTTLPSSHVTCLYPAGFSNACSFLSSHIHPIEYTRNSLGSCYFPPRTTIRAPHEYFVVLTASRSRPSEASRLRVTHVLPREQKVVRNHPPVPRRDDFHPPLMASIASLTVSPAAIGLAFSTISSDPIRVAAVTIPRWEEDRRAFPCVLNCVC
jgi:hypothetical protein